MIKRHGSILRQVSLNLREEIDGPNKKSHQLYQSKYLLKFFLFMCTAARGFSYV